VVKGNAMLKATNEVFAHEISMTMEKFQHIVPVASLLPAYSGKLRR
jgi:hypothetical protein